MFTSINTHKYLFMLEMQVQNINALRILIAEGGVAEDTAESALDDIPNADLRKTMKGSKPIHTCIAIHCNGQIGLPVELQNNTR